jgi:hypothetical protein
LKRAGSMVLVLLVATPLLGNQSDGISSMLAGGSDENSSASKVSSSDYVVIGASPLLERFVRSQIQVMQPEVPPRRIVFVSHERYLESTKAFHLHIPRGYVSTMFTHMPSGSIFIDDDRCYDKGTLADRLAHELGHLTSDSANEQAADQAARIYRKCLRAVARRTNVQP